MAPAEILTAVTALVAISLAVTAPALILAVVIAFAARAAVHYNRPPIDGDLLWGLLLLPGGSAMSWLDTAPTRRTLTVRKSRVRRRRF